MATTYKSLGTITLTSDVIGITFSSIPSSYTDLILKVSARSDYAAIVDYLKLTFNGDSSAIYTEGRMVGYGTTGQAADRVTSQTYVQQFPINGASSTTSAFSAGEIYIPNYSGNQSKSFSATGVVEHNTTSNNQILMEGGLYDTGTAISSIFMQSANGTVLKSGSTFYLYGVEKYGTSGSGSASNASILAKATGGTISTDGSYVYHKFTSAGTFTPTQALTVEALVVAGGGGGAPAAGVTIGGGGGAGGVCYHSGKSLSNGVGYTVTIGAGATGGQTGSAYAPSGSNSVFDTITANGGGGGGAGYTDSGNKDGRSGGSGGGGGHLTTSSTGTGGTSNQSTSGGATGYGYAGGTGTHSPGNYANAGGGGGAGAVGQNGGVGGNSNSGNGGAGLGTWSTWASATTSGVSGYFAGGGGGGGGNGSGTQGTGGIGGGAAGGWTGNAAQATNATVNTGGGGGGGPVYGGQGGSGIVIVRYAV